MADINITLSTETGGVAREATLPADVRVGQLLKVLPQAAGRAVTDSQGRPIGYRLYAGNQELNQDQTLAEAGVVDGATLSLQQEATAGALAMAVLTDLLCVVGAPKSAPVRLTIDSPAFRLSLLIDVPEGRTCPM